MKGFTEAQLKKIRFKKSFDIYAFDLVFVFSLSFYDHTLDFIFTFWVDLSLRILFQPVMTDTFISNSTKSLSFCIFPSSSLKNHFFLRSPLFC